MEMRKFVLFAGLIVAGHLAAQDGVADPVVMTVDGKPVSRTEFEAIYKKNNKDAAVTQQALDEYLDLFINYKLKVREAEVLGMDTVTKFRTELDGYRKQLARPYLIDRELNDQLIKEAYDRSRTEMRASHILVQVGEEATPEDTAAAWKRIMALRERVAKGEDFGTVAKSKGGSDDPSAQKNGGDLGWFSALQMRPPFERSVYPTPVGQLSQPVRTRFGYHIIKVTDTRPARGQVKVAHVMLRASDQDTPERQADTERRIREIHQQVASGSVTFADAALKFSEDESSSTKGGELPMFGTGKMIEEFEDVAFGLKANDEVSAPFKTRYGWHIVKRLDAMPPPAFEQAKADLKSRISRDSRADITRRAFLDKLRANYNYKPDLKAVKAVVPLLDSTIFRKGAQVLDTLSRKDVVEGLIVRKDGRYKRELNGTIKEGKLVNVRSRKHDDLTQTPTDTVVVRDVHEGWTPDAARAAKLTKPVFTIDGRSFTQADLLAYLQDKQRREPGRSFSAYVDERFQQFVDDKLMEYEDGRLEEKYPEFRLLMKEYRDGILLFELTDQKVWSKAVKDSTGLQAYHKAHERDFMWDTRYRGDIYTCANADVAKKARALYKKGKRGADLQAELTKTSALDLEHVNGTWTADEKPYLKGIVNIGLSENFNVDGRVVMVDLQEVIPATPKTMDEARGLITAAYQDQLEKDWITELRGKYEVRVNKDVLYSIR